MPCGIAPGCSSSLKEHFCIFALNYLNSLWSFLFKICDLFVMNFHQPDGWGRTSFISPNQSYHSLLNNEWHSYEALCYLSTGPGREGQRLTVQWSREIRPEAHWKHTEGTLWQKPLEVPTSVLDLRNRMLSFSWVNGQHKESFFQHPLQLGVAPG